MDELFEFVCLPRIGEQLYLVFTGIDGEEHAVLALVKTLCHFSATGRRTPFVVMDAVEICGHCYSEEHHEMDCPALEEDAEE